MEDQLVGRRMHEPEVIRATATKLAKEIALRLHEIGFTTEEVSGISRAAAIDVLEFAAKPPS
jgi:hypothetical protein